MRIVVVNHLILGSGQRLFEQENHLARLKLAESSATSNGVILATYQAV